jgi:hypothetical protein
METAPASRSARITTEEAIEINNSLDSGPGVVHVQAADPFGLKAEVRALISNTAWKYNKSILDQVELTCSFAREGTWEKLRDKMMAQFNQCIEETSALVGGRIMQEIKERQDGNGPVNGAD